MKFDLMQYMLGNIDVYGNEVDSAKFKKKSSFGEYLFNTFNMDASNILFKHIADEVEFPDIISKPNFIVNVYTNIYVISVKFVEIHHNIYENLHILEQTIKQEFHKFLNCDNCCVKVEDGNVFIAFSHFDSNLDFFDSFKQGK